MIVAISNLLLIYMIAQKSVTALYPEILSVSNFMILQTFEKGWSKIQFNLRTIRNNESKKYKNKRTIRIRIIKKAKLISE